MSHLDDIRKAMPDEMSLQEWEEQEMERLRSFTIDWLAWHKDSPEDYPLKMLSGDWDEQYRIYEEWP